MDSVVDSSHGGAEQSGTDHLSPHLADAFLRAVKIMAKLRAPGGCPWDREQTFTSIRRHTLEETYEVLDAIDRQNWNGLRDELGDLLLQVLFYAEMAEEAGYFNLQDVIEGLNAKLVRRHPHVFARQRGVETADQVRKNWEAIKKAEAPSGLKSEESLLDGVPRALPALMEAAKLGSKASSVRFDWESAGGVLVKLEEEMAELRQALSTSSGTSGRAQQEEEMGDLLFTAANLARKLGLQAELALRGANAKFRGRFQQMEALASEGKPLGDCSSNELEDLWNQAKARERENRAKSLDRSESYAQEDPA
jgi:XTP/dITP diphosphohydrolase/ATP diphosphatase